MRFRARKPDLSRAERSGSAVAAETLALWPWWLERQLRPGSDAAAAISDSGLVENVTGRQWLTVGVRDHDGADVDPRGLVVPHGQTWAIDWWVGGDDRWYLPSREAGVRQSRTGAAPIVETSMRVPGGDIRQVVFGALDDEGAPVTVIDITNDTPVPVALALAARPVGLLGMGSISQIDLDGCTVSIEGEVAFTISRPPARMASGAAGVDALEQTVRGDATDEWTPTRCGDGFANAVFVVPLPHRTSVRVIVGSAAGSATTAEDIESGWAAHLRDVADVVTGDMALNEAFRAACVDVVRAAEPAGLTAVGMAEEADDVYARMLAASPPSTTDIRGLGRLYAVSGRTDALEEHIGAIAKYLDVLRRNGSRLGSAPLAKALRAIDQEGVAETADALDGEVGNGTTTPGSRPVAPLLAHVRGLSAGGDATGIDELARLVKVASDTHAWPTALHPRLDTGCAGSGHDPTVSAAMIETIIASMVTESVDGLRVLPVCPATWFGHDLSAERIPTRHGRFSFAVRWHGARPALLWELDSTDGEVTVTCGLDAGWRTVEASGDALLAAPAQADSFS